MTDIAATMDTATSIARHQTGLEPCAMMGLLPHQLVEAHALDMAVSVAGIVTAISHLNTRAHSLTPISFT